MFKPGTKVRMVRRLTKEENVSNTFKSSEYYVGKTGEVINISASPSDTEFESKIENVPVKFSWNYSVGKNSPAKLEEGEYTAIGWGFIPVVCLEVV